MTLRSALLTLAIATAPLAHAKCAMFMGQDATSPNGNFRIVVAALKGGTYDFEYFKKDGKGWKQIAKASVPAHGHHAQFYVANDGSGFALYDQYEGIELYSPTGKARATWTADQILKKVGDKRVGHWTCHGNGGWTEEWKATRNGDTITASAGRNSMVVVDLSRATLREESAIGRTVLIVTGFAATAVAAGVARFRR